jgi:hypothetical protein
LKTGKALSAEDTEYIEIYTSRIRSLLNGGTPTDSHITMRLKRDNPTPGA